MIRSLGPSGLAGYTRRSRSLDEFGEMLVVGGCVFVFGLKSEGAWESHRLGEGQGSQDVWRRRRRRRRRRLVGWWWRDDLGAWGAGGLRLITAVSVEVVALTDLEAGVCSCVG